MDGGDQHWGALPPPMMANRAWREMEIIQEATYYFIIIIVSIILWYQYFLLDISVIFSISQQQH